jgi:hypothetical protein
LGFDLSIKSVRIREDSASSVTMATVKVEDPLFARELSNRMKDHMPSLTVVPMALDARQTNCRKVHISWHKASRSVWLNFGISDIATRVAGKFNSGVYKCLGQSVRSSPAKLSGRSYRNSTPWTIILSDVPSEANAEDIKRAIASPLDKPRHIEMGPSSYHAADAEASVIVRKHLEEHGPLENFFLAFKSKSKRVKATAWFQDEADAKAACSLNNRSLGILRNGKVTVTLVHSAKWKVSMGVYYASKSRIDKEFEHWRDSRLSFHVYPDTLKRFTTLKIEGDSEREMANARKTLDQILGGTIMKDGEHVVWTAALGSNGQAYTKLKSIEKELEVLIVRDKSKRELRFYGPPENIQPAILRVSEMLREEFSSSFEIDLNAHQISWMMQGGFKRLEHDLGKGVLIFNAVSKIITINGTHEQHKAALEIIGHESMAKKDSDAPYELGEDCPVCFCEADVPIQMSCKHTYCLDCFEQCCTAAAATSKDEFQIKCHGNEGNCSAVFTLRELKGHLPSSVFEAVLKSSFEEYIQRRQQLLRYCPTPDCGYVYRCSPSSASAVPSYTCPNCFEPLCTSCHARHGGYTCAEYKDIASGGLEALEKLKKELNIKDCPNCKTSMEKIAGCNHMTCVACKAHICWVCMQVFETSDHCYKHMNEKHGGNGLVKYY